MKIIKLLISVFILLSFLSLNSFTQEMGPPKPVDNKVFDAMCGEWTGVSDMMGAKMKEEMKIYWNLNHQFIFMELTSTGIDNPNMTYRGLGIYGVNKDGKAVTWWFDDWGAEGVATGTGTFEENKLNTSSSNPMYKENRVIEIMGEEIIMTADMTMNMGGQEMNIKESTTFKRK
jgi:hypothetical protein